MLIGGSVALSILALALPRTNPRLDGRQAVLGIGFLLLVIAGVIVQDQSPVDVLTRTKFRNPFPLSVGAIGFILLAGQAVFVALVWRKALAAVAHPASPRAPSAERLWAFQRLRRHPALYRALVSTAVPAALVSIVTIVRDRRSRVDRDDRRLESESRSPAHHPLGVPPCRWRRGDFTRGA